MTSNSLKTAVRRALSRSRDSSGKAPAGLVAFTAVAVVGLGLLAAWLLGLLDQGIKHHDDPVVIDNPKIEVGRRNAAKAPRREGSDKKWSLHEMKPFVKIVVTTYEQGVACSLEKALSNVDKVELQLVKDSAQANATFDVSLVQVGNYKEAMVESRHDDLMFESEGGQNPKKIKDKGDKLHVGQIKFGNDYICVAANGKPESGQCGSWATLPQKLEIKICANNTCTSTPHKMP